MPCDTVSQAEVFFGKDTSREMLARAMKILGVETWSLGEPVKAGQPGKLTFDTWGGVDAAMVRREYSKQIVTEGARKFGWKMSVQPDGKLLVQKGTF